MRIDLDERMNKELFEDEDIRIGMTKEVYVPDIVIQARENAFKKIVQREEKKKTTHFPGVVKGVAAAAICAVTLSGFAIANPVFASQIPVLGSLFKQLNDVISFKGDYEEYAEPFTEVVVNEQEEAAKVTTEKNQKQIVQTENGITITLSECYSNDSALYLTLALESEDKLPDDLINAEAQELLIPDAMISFSFNQEPQILYDYEIEGKCLDDHNFIGLLRCELDPYLKIYHEDTGELDSVALPETYDVNLVINKIVGNRSESKEKPAMPEDIREKYESGLSDNGLEAMLADPDIYLTFTDEEKEIEHKLYTAMMNSYNERYPDVMQYPNPYDHWWIDGEWNFTFPVTVNVDETIKKEIHAEEIADGIGTVVVEKSPFEITVVADGVKAWDYFFVILDADGNKLEYARTGGGINTYPVYETDISKVSVYICDYTEYMDELKGYYYSDEYQEIAKEKTFKQLLEERCIYSEEIAF